MRFILLLKADENSEAGILPDAALLTAMGKYNEELVKAGVMLAGEGLQATSKGFRTSLSKGKFTVTDGPFAEAKEHIAGYFILQVKSKEEAIEWAKRVPFDAGGPSATAGGNGEIEIRQLTEVSDFPPDYFEGMGGPPPQDAASGLAARAPVASEAGKPRYLMMFKADARTEAGQLPTKVEFAAMGRLMGEMGAKGICVGGEGLRPSSLGAKVIFSNGKRSVVDGPFTESKEMISGFAIFKVGSKDEAVAIAKQGLELNGDGVSEARRLFDEADFGPELLAQVPEVFEAERAMRAKTGQAQA